MIVKKISNYISTPNLDILPICKVKYCSLQWLEKRLELPDFLYIILEDIKEPRITFWHERLKTGEGFGHKKFHLDGMGKSDEIHRLITFNGQPTLGEDGLELTSNHVWEFSGDYSHKAQSTLNDCNRLLIRVSKTELNYRNYWQRFK
jgi:hypothetical protein